MSGHVGPNASLRRSLLAPSIGLIAVMLFTLIVAWSDSHDYSPDQYSDDVSWCVAHGYEVRSDSINQPVTCLENGQDIAIPPNSLHRLKERQ